MKLDKGITIKKAITTILTLLLLVSSVPSYGASPTFKDVPKTNWAYEYIEDMVKLGYLNGFPSGEFQPNGNLTLMQAISTLSRFTEPTAAEKSNAVSRYEYLFNELKVEEGWEKQGIAIALSKDIISEKEVRDAKKNNALNKAINRERVSELLAKGMGLEEVANGIDVLYVDYKDISNVNASKRKYLRVLLDADVLDPNGKGNKEFQPKANLNRAEMSTLLSKAANYVKKNPIKSEPIKDLVKDKTRVKGQVIAVSMRSNKNTIITIQNDEMGEESYYVSSNVEIIIDGKKVALLPSNPGYYAELELEDKDIKGIYIDSKTTEDSITGRIVDIDYSERIIYLEDNDFNSNSLANNNQLAVYISENTIFLKMDSTNGRFDDVKVGHIVMVGGVYRGKNLDANLIVIR